MEEDMEKTCPRCGMKLGEFRKTGLLGCAGCYCAFREEILPTVRRVQGRIRHEGKAPPEGAGQNYSLMLEQALLKENIERALREGRFSEAESKRALLKETNRILHGEDGK